MAQEAENTYRSMIETLGGMASFPHGVSMRPLIRQGKGYVTVVRADEPQVNDILLFEHLRKGEKKNIIHRLIEIRPDGTYVCRGDNCLNCEFIRRKDIVGRAERIFWTKKANSIIPRLLGAQVDKLNGGYTLSVTSPGYLRYVKFWNSIWPIRRQYYRIRAGVRPALVRIGWLKKLYHRIKD